jgi:hypothetical protein
MKARHRAAAAEQALGGALARVAVLTRDKQELQRTLTGSRALAGQLATEHLGECGHAQLAARERARSIALEQRIRNLTAALAEAVEHAGTIAARAADLTTANEQLALRLANALAPATDTTEDAR